MNSEQLTVNKKKKITTKGTELHRGGWEEIELGKCADIFRGGSPRPIQAYLTQRSDGINWVKIGDVEPNAKYIKKTNERIIAEGAVNSRVVNKGDFILSNSMSFGRPYILSIDGCIHDGWLTIQNYQKTFDIDFLYYVLGSDEVIQQYISMAAGSSVQNLNKEKVSKVVINIPPLPEQRCIAAVLSDTDELISTLEKLIAKKRAIKQGTMQGLLTGKRRLPGFREEWVEKKLGECLTVGHGQSQKEIETLNGKYPILATSGEIGRTNYFLYDRDSVLIGRKGTIDKPQYIETPFWTIDTLFYTIINDDYSVRFLYYLFCLIEWNKYNEASGVPSLSRKVIEDIDIIIPQTKDEQTAIATILSDMDAEIDTLTEKLNKYKNIKQGMMSELLTGRIRLVQPETKRTPVAKIIEFPNGKKTTKVHNQAIEDAVILGVITDLYATEQYPLAPFYSQKLPYLLHRHIEGVAKGYHKLAAGPYNPTLRYKTALPIALKKLYVIAHKASYKGHEYNNLTVGEGIDEAKKYFAKWFGDEPLEWLKQFKYIKNRRDELELLTTTDKAMVELRDSGKPINLFTVKDLIKKTPEWKDKLKRQIFSDENIKRAIQWSNELFGQEGKP